MAVNAALVIQAERDMETCACFPSEWIGRITTPADDGEASTIICSNAEHRAAAERWVRALTGKDPVFVEKRQKATA